MTDTLNGEELGEEIASLAARIDAATHHLMTRVRQFDESGEWHRQGAKSCAHWLSWRIGDTEGTAREKVRIARALGGLPKIDAAFAVGAVSYSKVRAMTRIATEENEAFLLQLAEHSTGAQLERMVRKYRGVVSAEEAKAGEGERRFTEKSMAYGMTKFEVVVSAEEAALVRELIEVARSDLRDVREGSGESPSPTKLDGFLHILRSFNQPADPRAAERAQVMVHLEKDIVGDDESLMATLDDGTRVSAETFRRLSCDGAVCAVTHADHDDEAPVDQKTPMDVGRRTRTIPTALDRSLLIRDRTCRFPGCHHDRWLHAHHIQHWAHGGETNLANLVLMCPHHHRLVHEGGFTVQWNEAGTQLEFRTPEGHVLPPFWTPDVSAETLTDWFVNRGLEIESFAYRCDWDGLPVDYDLIVQALCQSHTGAPYDTTKASR